MAFGPTSPTRPAPDGETPQGPARPVEVARGHPRAEETSELIAALRRCEAERDQERSARLQSEGRLRRLLHEASEGVFRAAPDGRLLAANPALVRLLGYGAAEELLREAGPLGSHLAADPARHAELSEQLRRQGHVHGFEEAWARKDGGRVWVSLSVRAVRGDGGEVVALEGTAEDRSEHRQFREQVLQAQQMAVMGLLAGAVANEFNNLMSVVQGGSELLLSVAPAGSPQRALAEELRKAGERAAALAGQFLTVGRRRPQGAAPVNLNAVLAGLERMLRALLGDGRELVLAPDPELHPLSADPVHVEQAVLHLMAHAHDAAAVRGRVVLRTANQVVRAHPDDGDAGVPPGEYVVLTVEGAGGTGPALSAAQDLFARYGGRVASEGAALRVYLPRGRPESAEPAASAGDRRLASLSKQVRTLPKK